MIELQADTGSGWFTVKTDNGSNDEAGARWAGWALVHASERPQLRSDGTPAPYRVATDREDLALLAHAATGRACTLQCPAYGDDQPRWYLTLAATAPGGQCLGRG